MAMMRRLSGPILRGPAIQRALTLTSQSACVVNNNTDDSIREELRLSVRKNLECECAYPRYISQQAFVLQLLANEARPCNSDEARKAAWRIRDVAYNIINASDDFMDASHGFTD